MRGVIIRDDKGVMKAKLSPLSAGRILAADAGHWRPYNSKESLNTKSVFEIDVDSSYTVGGGPYETKIYLWKGDILIPV